MRTRNGKSHGMEWPPDKAMAHEDERSHKATTQKKKEKICGFFDIKGCLVGMFFEDCDNVFVMSVGSGGDFEGTKTLSAFDVTEANGDVDAEDEADDNGESHRCHEIAALFGRYPFGDACYMRDARQHAAGPIARCDRGKTFGYVGDGCDVSIAEKCEDKIPGANRWFL